MHMRTAGSNAQRIILTRYTVMVILLNLLLLLPIATYLLAKRTGSKHVFRVTGIAFGLVVAPLSLGLYSWYSFSSWGVVPGLLGLGMSLVHESLGFQLAVSAGVVNGVEVSSNVFQHIIVELFNAVAWAIVYGMLGHGLDYLRAKKSSQTRSA